ncbi:MAG: DUF4349 domain-containing protein [Clostridia bacterium]
MKKLLLIMIISATLVGCSSTSYDSAMSENSSSSTSSSMSTTVVTETSDKTVTSDEMSEKMSYTVDISLETKTFDENIQLLNQTTEKYAGFIETSRIYGDIQRNAYYTIRIPTVDYLAFLSEIEGSGNVYSTSTKTENLTSQFIDVNARLLTLETQETRLLELLEIAETVEDIITIEARLSEIRYEIESLTTNLRSLTLKVDYSTINININEVIEYQKNTTFGQEITATVSDSISDLKDSLQNFALFTIYIAPFLVIWVLILIILCLIFKKFIKKVLYFIKNFRFRK